MAGPIPTQLVAAVAARLGEDGHRYSARQLYYAVCAEVEPPEVTRGSAQAGCGALLVATGVVAGILVSIYVGLLVPIGMLIIGMGVQRRRAEHDRPSTRPLALGYEEFVNDHLAPLRQSDPDALGGLAQARDLSDAATATALVVCDRAETAAMVAANLAGRGIAVSDEDTAASRIDGTQRVFALHDADPRGCALALRLRNAGADTVVDLGLRPAQLSGRHLQVIEGAPHIVAADVAALLSPDEIVWLAAGRRAEMAILTPREIADAVVAGVAAQKHLQPPGAAEGVLLSTVQMAEPSQT